MVKHEHKQSKRIEQQRATTLKNESAESNVAECQKELLAGKYDIKIDFKQPYYKRIANLSQEPVAYHLYKARHFERKAFFQNNVQGEENNLRGLNSQQKVFVEKLLKMTNARVIG